jgi:ABC-type polysaccharide/polyol phosphate export permease
MGFAVAWWIDSTQGYHAIMMVALIPLWMLSGAMFPAEGAGGVIPTLMRWNPMTYVVSGLRAGLGGTGGSSVGTLALGVTAATALVSLTVAVAVCGRRA